MHIIVIVYMDNIIVTVSNLLAITQFIERLGTQFQLKDLGNLSYFLGVQACRNSYRLHLRQSKYIFDLLYKIDMARAKTLSSTTVVGKKLSNQDGNLRTDPSQYRMIVGALQYWSIFRPDISYIVNQLCQFLHNPR